MTDERSNPRAWSEEDLADPHGVSDKDERVREMFASIAGHYDLNNRLHSLGRDQAWRRFAVRFAGVRRGDEVLDVACGTGDLTEAFARAGAGRAVGLDYTREMLTIARRKRQPMSERLRSRITYTLGDAQELPFEDATFDIVSIAFGIRNVQEPDQALREFRRVLRPRGRLIILEFTEPGFAPFRWLNSVYCKTIMPRTATLISRDKSGAYKYLPKSVSTFLSPEALSDAVRRAGFGEVRSKSLTMGICRCYRASVEAEEGE